MVALLLACKLSQDRHCPPRRFGSVLGMSAREVNELELQMLACLDYQLFIGQDHYQDYCLGLHDFLAQP